ncbi:hypothetical protein B0H67DRAFT_382239 [Lasiosphaeris hirsuta]|uniref:Uncharacterized protein n=1 Tax=Lasiosphaeris hirsuta TaxID=260670 RepID=A0AA40DLN5_9PEZI|nr:hypothetical protein B0H67DRAFT_382239 [Lasiosphaeris hirsuta]
MSKGDEAAGAGREPELVSSSPLSSLLSSPPSPPSILDDLQHHDEPPSTPPQNKQTRPRLLSHSRSPSLPLPLPAHNSMALHHVGIGTPSPLLSPLRRGYSNFSSSPTWPPRSPPPPLGIIAGSGPREFSEDEGELTRDSRDVLAERLADLVHHLRGAGSAGGAVDELHAKVDEMEAILGGSPGTIGRRATRAVSPVEFRPQHHHRVGAGSGMMMSGIFRPEGDGVGGGVGPEPARVLATPPWLAVTRFGQVTAVESEVKVQVGSATKLAAKAQRPDVTASVVAEAQKLNDTLLEVVKNMKARREESIHIHALLIERAEAAAARILELEKEVIDL